MEKRYIAINSLLDRWDLKSRQSIYDRSKKDPHFPKPIKFGPGMVRFDLDEIEAYERIKAEAREVVA